MSDSSREWRVTYKRKGKKRYRTFQTEAPTRRWALILAGRQAEAFPDVDPDKPWCCQGYECGCQGMTNQDWWDDRNKVMSEGEFAPGAAEEVTVESRAVGGWVSNDHLP